MIIVITPLYYPQYTLHTGTAEIHPLPWEKHKSNLIQRKGMGILDWLFKRTPDSPTKEEFENFKREVEEGRASDYQQLRSEFLYALSSVRMKPYDDTQIRRQIEGLKVGGRLALENRGRMEELEKLVHEIDGKILTEKEVTQLIEDILNDKLKKQDTQVASTRVTEVVQRVDDTSPRIKMDVTYLGHMTDVEKNILRELASHQATGEKKWVAFQTIVGLCYPDEEYDKIRTTVHNYLSRLLNRGFVKRKKIGKYSYYSITEKTLEKQLDSNMAELKKRIVGQ
jgi:predicted transcriptional regulator